MNSDELITEEQKKRLTEMETLLVGWLRKKHTTTNYAVRQVCHMEMNKLIYEHDGIFWAALTNNPGTK